MCLNKPIRIPVGSDGASAYVAYAQNDSGSGFSYTPDLSRKYISVVVKKGNIAQTDFTDWMLYLGTDGSDGTDGISVVDVTVSDGVAAIGGVVYALNSLIIELSNGTYVNAGIINASPTWTTITLINGWTSDVGINIAKYSIHGGFLYFRGRLTYTAATNDTFATVASLGITGNIFTTVGTDHAGANGQLDEIALFLIDSSGNISVSGANSTLTGTRVFLDSVPPISIR